MVTRESGVDEKYYEMIKSGSIAENLMIKARKNIYDDFIKLCAPSPIDRIIDVGVSDVIGSGDNMLERLYCHKSNITAVGLGDGAEFSVEFPEVDYLKIQAGMPLPFEDKTFSVSVSNAVLEHVGSPARQKYFIEEAIRVSKKTFISLPNRYFLIEHHTALPLVAWSDLTFNIGCRLSSKEEWSKSENLILMSLGKLRMLMPENVDVKYGYTGLKFGILSSNFYAYIKDDNENK